MRRLSLKTLLDGGYRGLKWPPDDVAARWSTVSEYRRYYHAFAGELWQHRPDLHSGADGSDLGRFTPVPLAKEIANFSAALLFGEPPIIAAREPGDQAPLDALVEANRLDELLTASGEYVAVEGGLRVSLDDGVPGGVVLDYIPGDRIIWRERFGRFTSGGIIVLEQREQNQTWRLFEDHDVGRVSRRLFKGHLTRLGDAVTLSEGPEIWRELKPETATGLLDRATLTKWENKPGGVSDLAGILPLLDSYDDGQTMIRRKSDASVPIVAGHESILDENREFQAWRGITLRTPDDRIPDSLIPADKLFQVLQAEFPAAEMVLYLDHLRTGIITAAGYSPESFTGDGLGGQADSGRALALRQTRTAHTRNSKATMTERAVSEALGVALALFLGRPLAEPCMPLVALTDTVKNVSEDVAEEQDTPTTPTNPTTEGDE